MFGCLGCKEQIEDKDEMIAICGPATWDILAPQTVREAWGGWVVHLRATCLIDALITYGKEQGLDKLTMKIMLNKLQHDD